MKIENIETLLLQEMEEVKGGAGICKCTGGAGVGGDDGVCSCTKGAAQKYVPSPELPSLPECICNSGSGMLIG